MKQGKELKKCMMLGMGFLILFSMLLLPFSGQASELDNVNQQLRQLQSEMHNAKNKQQQAEFLKMKVKKSLQKTKGERDYLLSEIDKETHEMDNVSYKIDKTELNLKQSLVEIQQIVQRIEERESLLNDRICLMYMEGNVAYADVLFGAASFSDLIARLDFLGMVAQEDKKLLKEHRQDQQLVVQKKQVLETNLQQVERLYTQLKDKKKKLIMKKKIKEVMIANYTKTIEESDDLSEEQDRLLVEMIRKRIQLTKKKAALLRPKRRRVYSSLQSTHTSAKLGSPLRDSHYISSSFGSRIDPITGRSGAFHRGLDMPAPHGTAIYAAEKGSVLMAEWWSGYGYCIVIDHGDGLWTVYAHIRNHGMKVKQGDQVVRGSKIAEVGATGLATGNHLHFEVRLHGKQVNPLSYLK